MIRTQYSLEPTGHAFPASTVHGSSAPVALGPKPGTSSIEILKIGLVPKLQKNNILVYNKEYIALITEIISGKKIIF